MSLEIVKRERKSERVRVCEREREREREREKERERESFLIFFSAEVEKLKSLKAKEVVEATQEAHCLLTSRFQKNSFFFLKI